MSSYFGAVTKVYLNVFTMVTADTVIKYLKGVIPDFSEKVDYRIKERGTEQHPVAGYAIMFNSLTDAEGWNMFVDEIINLSNRDFLYDNITIVARPRIFNHEVADQLGAIMHKLVDYPAITFRMERRVIKGEEEMARKETGRETYEAEKAHAEELRFHMNKTIDTMMAFIKPEGGNK